MANLKKLHEFDVTGKPFPFAGNSAVSEPGREAVLDQADM